MNREDIIRMAKNSGLFVELVLERDLDWLERFATLVASAEREACAQMLEAASKTGKIISCTSAAKAIRARGQA
jgi:hypothetical protein